KYFRKALSRGKKSEKLWIEALDACVEKNKPLAIEFQRTLAGELPEGWETALAKFPNGSKEIATRKASETFMQAVATKIPELVGGSADLNPSCFTWLKGMGDFQHPELSKEGLHGMVGGAWDYSGQNIHFGVREHAMGAVAVGMSLHDGIIPFTGTFLTFADYMRPPMRLAALMGLRVIFVFTHDSIGVGEDGPTHQPIEQTMNLRQVPNMTVLRPADGNETIEAWRIAIANTAGPTTLIFSRQNLPVLDRSVCASASGVHQGGYVLWESSPEPELILIATGSEVAMTLEAGQKLASDHIRVRVVSMPSWEIFDRQPKEYRDAVLPSGITARMSVEADIKLGWEHYVGLSGTCIGMETFGASAPGPVLYEKFGFTTAHIVSAAKAIFNRS
ncbi:MAG: transketolase C-terminal domain-containing protein, partial [Smithellaceae bacterium]